MRRFVTFTVVFLCATIGLAQTKQSDQQAPKDSVLNRIDSLVQITNAWLEQIELDHSLKQRYKLYQTENIYTLLQLDTKTGMIEQVQWSLDSENEGSVTINNDDLNYGFGHGSGSFELYPTKICTSLFYWTKQVEENGMFNGG
ncbi:hypothetical protein [Candidatus Bacteroides intestinigallinarum]|uniref:hypothetical protein n=1 Tax=Candidatus Bacteroides intestinigallinarum TaxID=2838470 RepID=UPI0021659A36|nr:hypothetical protein [Candidatus Bacteroides intestinigallinarum]MCS3202701.1 hypothetical protein [Candidatus Bacteroides intestinigallinarum]